MIILGVDPGASGALAWVDGAGALQRVEDMPTFQVMRGGTAKREVDVLGLVSLLSDFAPDVCFFEHVGGQQGDSPSSAFNFGRATGVAEASVKLSGARFEHVPPATWKRAMGLIGTAKDQSRAKATARWPGWAKTFAPAVKGHGRADAALLAEYGRQMLFKEGLLGGNETIEQNIFG